MGDDDVRCLEYYLAKVQKCRTTLCLVKKRRDMAPTILQLLQRIHPGLRCDQVEFQSRVLGDQI